MTYGIEGAGGYESFTIWRYTNFLYTVDNGQPYPFAKLKQDLAAGDLKRFDTPLVDLLNVRWYIGMAAPAPHWIERFRPRPGVRRTRCTRPRGIRSSASGKIRTSLRRAFVVHHATVLDR